LCDIIVVNVSASSEDKDDIKDSFYEGVKQVSDQPAMYHMKIFLDKFNAKLG
jgi:hypothetical protein